jgi:hypothetical protein
VLTCKERKEARGAFRHHLANGGLVCTTLQDQTIMHFRARCGYAVWDAEARKSARHAVAFCALDSLLPMHPMIKVALTGGAT